MKRITLMLAAVSLLALTSCETLQQNLTPSQAQADVVALGTIAKPHLTLSAQHQLHVFAVRVQATNDYAQLIQLLPRTGNEAADKLIAQVTKYILLGKPYADAVAAGLLANFTQ